MRQRLRAEVTTPRLQLPSGPRPSEARKTIQNRASPASQVCDELAGCRCAACRCSVPPGRAALRQTAGALTLSGQAQARGAQRRSSGPSPAKASASEDASQAPMRRMDRRWRTCWHPEPNSYRGAALSHVTMCPGFNGVTSCTTRVAAQGAEFAHACTLPLNKPFMAKGSVVMRDMLVCPCGLTTATSRKKC